MKREGRQRGMVRTYPIIAAPWNPRSESNTRYVNKFNSPPTAGLFARVPQKPTNHSKFTGKCGRPKCTSCHIHPACKSKDKAKGTQKLRSYDVVTNYRLMTWRMVGAAGPGLKFSGFSATGILDQMANDYHIDQDDDVDNYEGDVYGGSFYSEINDVVDNYDSNNVLDEDVLNSNSINVLDDDVHDSNINNVVDDDDEDTIMSFCDVGFDWEQVDGDEDWCVV